MAMVIVAGASVVGLAYIYLDHSFLAKKVYKVAPSRVQKLYKAASTEVRCTPPVIEEPFEVKVEELLPGLQFEKAIQVRQDRHNSAIWYVGEHRGKIFKIEKGVKTLILDITDRVKYGVQWGLQGFALHPDFPRNPRIAITYTASPSSPFLELESRLSVFFGNQEKVDPESEVIVLHNQQNGVHHAIAGLEFAPDGNLLVGWGEGSGTDPKNLGGKLLRINIDKVTAATQYEIPDDNPFRNRTFLPEVFASGFRNPWRLSVDRQTNEVWVGDVGSRRFEEVNLISAGQHYGWPEFEGTQCIKKPCQGTNTEPVTWHPTSSFGAVIGGYYYRGKIDVLRERYLYGSVRKGLWAYDKKAGKDTLITYDLPGKLIFSFAQNHLGEIMFIALLEGNVNNAQDPQPTKIYKIVDVIPSQQVLSEGEASLAELGCTGNDLTRTHMTYEISTPKWESGLQARRYAPRKFKKEIWGAQQRPIHKKELFIRELYFEDIPIETQMIAYHRGTWQTVAFAWNEAGDDAVPVKEPMARTLPNGETWLHRSPLQCQQCHNARHGWLLGYRFSQLDRSVKREEQWVNQLDYWVNQKFIYGIKARLRADPMPDPTDEAVSTIPRARAYLDVNCAFCHQQGGMAQHVGIDLSRTANPESMGWCRTRHDQFFIDPQAPSQSLILTRMRDPAFPMPPDRMQVDQDGMRLVENWLTTLSHCPQ